VKTEGEKLLLIELEIKFPVTGAVLKQHVAFRNVLFMIQGKTLIMEDLQKHGRITGALIKDRK
jgi:hypothetical protein